MSAVDKKRIAELEFMLAKYQDELIPMLNNRIEELIAALDDAAVVVRCKDCKYCSQNTPDGLHWCEENEIGALMDDDFCSHGERRDDNDKTRG